MHTTCLEVVARNTGLYKMAKNLCTVSSYSVTAAVAGGVADILGRRGRVKRLSFWLDKTMGFNWLSVQCNLFLFKFVWPLWNFEMKIGSGLSLCIR